MPTRSSGVPMRCNGIRFTMSLTMLPGVTVRVASVSIGPGAMALIRMFDQPSSVASCCVRLLTPAFASP